MKLKKKPETGIEILFDPRYTVISIQISGKKTKVMKSI